MKRFIKVVKNIVYVMFFSLVLFIIVLNMLSVYDLSLFGFRTFRIMSGSMNPNVLEDSFILTKEYDDYKVGEVVTYKKNGEHITHRIIKIDGDQITTRGDSNNTQDENISKDMIIGKVIFSFAWYGFVIFLFEQPITWILIFVVLITLFYLNHIFEKKEKLEAKKEEILEEEKE